LQIVDITDVPFKKRKEIGMDFFFLWMAAAAAAKYGWRNIFLWFLMNGVVLLSFGRPFRHYQDCYFCLMFLRRFLFKSFI